MASLGDTLRDRRIALGMSIEAAQEGTKIRGKLLMALEDGAYDRLPNPGYVRGYISSYARFLELDPVPLLNMYKAESGASRPAGLNFPQATREAVARTGEQHAIPWGTAISVAIAIGVVSLIIWAATSMVGEPEPESITPAPVATESVAPAEQPATTEKAPAVEPETAAQPFTVTIKIDDEGASWLRITVDGKKAYEGTLAGGQSKEYEVTSAISVAVGKPEAVTVLRDGTEVKVPRSGEPPVLTLKAKEIAR